MGTSGKMDRWSSIEGYECPKCGVGDISFIALSAKSPDQKALWYCNECKYKEEKYVKALKPYPVPLVIERQRPPRTIYEEQLFKFERFLGLKRHNIRMTNPKIKYRTYWKEVKQ